MDKAKKKVVIPFKLINNLIFIPIKVNGEELTFLLDTGVEETILFSLDDKEQIKFFHIEKLKLKGLGSNEAVDAYKSSKNKLDANGYTDLDHEIYLVLDQEFNFSSQVGIPVNGIIGYHFFKNHKVAIDYENKKVTVYADSNKKIIKQLNRRFFKDSISIEDSKPYFISRITQNDNTVSSKLLLDTGNSDALWIFLNKTQAIIKPDYYIHDFLGRGFSGEIFGIRGRIASFSFGNNTFNKPIATFPDSTSIKSANFVSKRVGSIGGEVLSRFKVVFDYKNHLVYTSPNDKLNEPFNFNMSGIEVEHAGLEWTKETVEDVRQGIKVYSSTNDERIQNSLQIRFELKPIFSIASVRVNSNAEKAGLKKGDKILKINGKNAHDLTIERINGLLKSEEGKTIEIEIERNNKTYSYSFQLKSIL
ncbi:PDZ domain-containing protein [Flavobacterium sp.]|uniref:PDZ domain-containing protein n=1 Tax=Flavobacterium sp. TaxID=239 RepID=UPI002FDAA4AD